MTEIPYDGMNVGYDIKHLRQEPASPTRAVLEAQINFSYNGKQTKGENWENKTTGGPKKRIPATQRNKRHGRKKTWECDGLEQATKEEKNFLKTNI